MITTIVIVFVVFLVLIYTLFFAYIKLFHKFWYLQPCFHFYDITNYFKSPQIILSSPLNNSYCNFKNITTETFQHAKTEDAVKLINNHFVKNGTYKIDNKQNFLPYFICHENTSFISIYRHDRPLAERTTGRIFSDKKVIGVITSRPLIFNDTIEVNYVDFLCVHKEHRKQGIAEQLIQTHEFNQRTLNQKVNISLFKREGPQMFINPLTSYQSYLCTRRDTNSLIHVTPFNTKHVYEFSNLLKRLPFDCIIHPTISAIMELVKTENLYIFFIQDEDSILAFYVFKNCCQDMASCIGSYKSKHVNNDSFKSGFASCVKKLPFSQIIIECLSHNVYLVESSDQQFIKMGYFFYNYIYQSQKPHQCFVLL